MHTHTVYMCSSALTPSSARSTLAGPRDQQGHPDTAYHKSASHCLKHGLAQAVGSSCLYSDPSFICPVCTVHGSFLFAHCVASERPLWPIEHYFVLITSHDKNDYGCVQMALLIYNRGWVWRQWLLSNPPWLYTFYRGTADQNWFCVVVF